HAHCRRNRRLGHPTLTQQHHLDALALRRRYLPAQRSFQPPHLGFAAFDHLFSPNQMAQANHTSGEENSPRLSPKNPDSSRYGGSISLIDERLSFSVQVLRLFDNRLRPIEKINQRLGRWQRFLNLPELCSTETGNMTNEVN